MASTLCPAQPAGSTPAQPVGSAPATASAPMRIEPISAVPSEEPRFCAVYCSPPTSLRADSPTPPLEPPTALKHNIERRAHGHHEREGERVAVVPMQLRHMVKIHAVDGADERGSEQDGRPCGNLLDLLVLGLHLLDIVLQAGDDRRVTVDDRVEDGVEDRLGPAGEQLRV